MLQLALNSNFSFRISNDPNAYQAISMVERQSYVFLIDMMDWEDGDPRYFRNSNFTQYLIIKAFDIMVNTGVNIFEDCDFRSVYGDLWSSVMELDDDETLIYWEETMGVYLPISESIIEETAPESLSWQNYRMASAVQLVSTIMTSILDDTFSLEMPLINEDFVISGVNSKYVVEIRIDNEDLGLLIVLDEDLNMLTILSVNHDPVGIDARDFPEWRKVIAVS